MFGKKKNTLNMYESTLFKKQLSVFKNKFQCFSTYQLEQIDMVLKDMIKERKKRK